MSTGGKRSALTFFHYETMHVLLNRVSAEYLEMPGLRLTPAQAARLMGLDASICETVLLRLSSEGFLKRTAKGTYCRSMGLL
jgi:hypothetical protein